MEKEVFIALMDRFPQAGFVFSVDDSSFLYLNSAFKTIFKITSDTADFDWLLQLIEPEDIEYLKENYYRLIGGFSVEGVDFRIRTDSEQERWIRLIPSFYNTSDSRLIMGIASDITDEVGNIATYTKYANKKNSILNILAHELRGSLSVAHVTNSVLKRDIQDENLRRLAENISSNIQAAINLIADLTAHEFVESAEVVLVKKRINIGVKMKELVEEYQNASEMIDRKFNFYSAAENIFIDLDESKFVQVMNNLITNALKFTREEGVITVSIEDKPLSVLFSVADNGIGIPEELQPVLFDKFTKASRKGLQGEPSLGLGMFVVKTIVEWHQGKIWFSSKENEGSTFYFEIPKLQEKLKDQTSF